MDDELETERFQVLFCEECGCDFDDDARGWTGHLAQEDDESETLVFFCPGCVDDLRRGVWPAAIPSEGRAARGSTATLFLRRWRPTRPV